MYLSYLMGTANITDADIKNLGIEVVGVEGPRYMKLKIDDSKLEAYRKLIREKMETGYWNETVGEKEIYFIFKFRDGHIEEFAFNDNNSHKIASLCSDFTGDPIEKTGKLLSYLANNEFYSDFIKQHYQMI